MANWRPGIWKDIPLVCGHAHRTTFSRRWRTYLCKICGVSQRKARKPFTFRSAATRARCVANGRRAGLAAVAAGQLWQGRPTVKPENT